MTAPPASPPPRPRRGGQPGNLNAVKHGFYSASFRLSDLAALETSHFSGLDEEIGLLRIYIRRLVESSGDLDDLPQAIHLLRALCLAAGTLARLLKTQHLLASGDEVSIALQQALEEIHASLAATGEFPPDEAIR